MSNFFLYFFGILAAIKSLTIKLDNLNLFILYVSFSSKSPIINEPGSTKNILLSDKRILSKFINFVIRPQCVAPNNIIQNINLENCNIIDPKGLVQFPYLRILNLKENSIYEMMDVLTVCKACIYLENINVLKNPFIQENKTTYRN